MRVLPDLPGLRVHRSNRVEVHATLLAALLTERDDPCDPITPDTVVVGNRGTERWLSHRLAHTLGVCANIDFPFPGSVVGRLTTWALDGVPRPTGWTRDAVQWVVLEELRALDGADPTWGPLLSWLHAEPPPAEGCVDRRVLGLARQIADVFDRLTTFRPEWTTAWSTAAPAVCPEGVSPWQPALWHRVVARLGPQHDAARMSEAIRRLRERPPAHAPFRHLHIFGLSSLPPLWLELLGAAARHLPTDLYLLTPSNQYWSDVRRGSADLPSPLVMARDRLATELERVLPPDLPPSPDRTRPNPTLATFGRIARDFQAVLERLPEGYRDAAHAEAEVFIDPVPDSGAAEGPPASALRWLQSDILHMRHPADHQSRLSSFERRRLDATDRSFQLHACYGLTRQLEALRDALLDLFSTMPDLQPRDVVVLCPDIQKVAPLVTAVFDRARSPGAPPAIPARVTDRTLREVNPVAEVLLQLLAMESSRLEAPTVLDFLALEPVRARFGLEPTDLPDVVELVRASGARWARDADHRVQFGQPADPLCTWRFGLERLALGVVMDADASEASPLDVWPEDRAGGVSLALVGRLLDFLATLSEVLDELGTSRSPDAWAALLDRVLDRLVAPTTAAGFRVRQVREAVAQLSSVPVATAPDAAPLVLDAGAIAAWLERPLGADSGPLGQQTGAVTFCSMLPERGVPARVVCLVGMDDGDFPRTGSTLGFDPTSSHPRVGDRDPRDEDRYLLLEALMAAREAMLVFWTGHDVRSNEAIAPAVPVGELVDVLEASFLPPRGWGSVSDFLVVHHPLQAFSPRNLVPGGLAPPAPQPGAVPHWLADLRWSFDRRLVDTATSARSPSRTERPFWPDSLQLRPPTDDDAPLSVDDLTRFWKQPVAWLVERELGLWLRESDAGIPRREALELDALERYSLRRELADVPGGSAAELARVHRRRSAQGLLPPGTLGQMVLDDAWAPVAVATDLLAPFRGPTEALRVEVDLGPEGSLSCSVPDVAEAGIVDLVIGKWEGRKVLDAWLRAVALTAAGRPTRAVLAWTGSGRSKPGLQALRPFGGSAPHATAYLTWLARWRRLGRSSPLPMGPRSSWAFVTTRLGRKGPRVGDTTDPAALPEDAVRDGGRAAIQHWLGSDRLTGDRSHPAVERLFGATCPIALDGDRLHPTFVALALGLWGPLLAAEEPA